MEEINKIRRLYQLKHVERHGPVGDRKESTAEHTWSSLILADYFLSVINDKKIDRLKVYELLMYHDVVEIETGDIPIHHDQKRQNKQENELAAAHVLKEHIPSELGAKFFDLFQEFEAAESREAIFAKAIDSFDALIHFLDYKTEWKGWTETMVLKYHGDKINKVPGLKQAFTKVLAFVKEQKYLDP